MRILLVNTLYPPYSVGGAERSVELLSTGLARNGHEVTVVSLKEPGERTSVDERDGVQVFRIALPNLYWPFATDVARRSTLRKLAWHAFDRMNLVAGHKLRTVIRSTKPHIIHSHNVTGFSTEVWREAGRSGVPSIHSTRDYSLICPRAMFRNGRNCKHVCSTCSVFSIRARRLSRALDAVIGISRFILERYRRAGFFQGVKDTSVIYNAIEEPHIEVARNVSLPLQIGYIGRLSPEKGVERLLRAFEQSRSQGVPVELVVAGRGKHTYENHLRSISRSAQWLGFVKPEEFFSRVDVLVVPSQWEEPFGRVVIEAYSYGVPVIAARRGGIVEIVEDGVTGWLFDPDNEGELERVLSRLPREMAVVERMGRAAKRKSRDFSVDGYVASYEDVYYRVLSRRGRV